MKLTFKVWRQNGASGEGKFETYAHDHVDVDSSFLETIDEINSKIITDGGDPITFDHDCREGICGSCSMTIDGKPHGPLKGTTACQLHMREFKDGETVTVEPWRADAFPVIKDLMVDRTAFDRIIQKGGFISVNTGNAVDANSIPINKEVSDEAFEAAACIGCGACVAACKNASAMLFVSAKVAHLNMLPQGKTEGFLHKHLRLRSRMSERHLSSKHRPTEPRVHLR